MIKKISLLLVTFLTFMSQMSLAQDSSIEQTMHESGKINVVVAIVVVIFIGLVFYLAKLDRKISKIEKELEK